MKISQKSIKKLTHEQSPKKKNITSHFRISVCMIVRNEEQNLADCLRSIQGLADEVIVVDTGSTDSTVAIALDFQAKVYHFTWCDDFSAARNESLRHATGDWIIWLDADDRLDKHQHAKIRRLADQSVAKGFYFILQNQGVDQAKCYQLRMFPNRPEIRFERPIHEQVGSAIARIGLQTQTTEIVLIHTGYSSPEVVQAKKKRYLELMAKWLAEHPSDLLIRYQFAWGLHTTDQHELAVKEFTVLLQQFPEQNKTDLIYLYSWILLGRSYLNLHHWDEALAALTTAYNINPKLSFLLISLAEIYASKGQYEEALSYLARASDQPENEITTFPLDYSILKYGKQVLLGKAYLELGQLDTAFQWLQQALELMPQKAEGYKYLAEWHRKKMQLPAAINAYQMAAIRDQQNFYYDFMIGEISFQQKLLAQARQSYLQAKKKNPAHPAIWMNLAIVERGCGRYAQALEYLNHLDKYFNGVRDVSLQVALTYFDQDDFAQARQKLQKIKLEGWAIELDYLITIYEGNFTRFETLLYQAHPELENSGQEDLFDYLVQEAKSAVTNHSYYRAELLLKLALHLHEVIDTQLLDEIVHVQVENGRIFQAITTLEEQIRFCDNHYKMIPILEKIADCYKMIGVKVAHQLCRQKIMQLQTAAELVIT